MEIKKVLMIVAAAAFVLGVNGMTATNASAQAWSKCKICHKFTAKKAVGPGWGKGDTGHGTQPAVFGREAGTSPGYRYKFTKYIKPGKAWHWDEAHLRAWMCDSHKAIKAFTGNPHARTKMPPQHICDPKKQDAIIAFMKTLS